MNGSDEPAFRELDSFTQAYIEAMFWTEHAPGVSTEEWNATEDHAEGSIPDDVGFDDLSDESLASIVADCREWQEANATDLALAYEAFHANGMAYDEASAGHDYWLTRNGHGAGFWDRGLGELGDRLSKACGRHEVYIYLGDDGKVYVQ
jgi:hypothetical protein